MTANISKIRREFPVFAVKPDWVYLDTSATAQVPQHVLDALAEYHCAYRASVHRGLYKEAVRATEAYEGARAKVAAFIGAASARDVIFTANATSSSNMLIASIERMKLFRAGDGIVTTVAEHHSSFLPLQDLAVRKRLTLHSIPLTDGYDLEYRRAEELITRRTKLVSVMLASNVVGTIYDVGRIAKRAHAVGALMIVDATAAVGHMPFSVHGLGADFVYFSGHKMCGPTGVGVLYGTQKNLEALPPSMFGGGMVETVTQRHTTWAGVPYRFEAGTPNIAGVIGLGAAVEYLTERNVADIRTYVEALLVRARDALADVPGVTVYAAEPGRNVGILSFTVKGVHPHDVAEVLARRGVAVRAGHHCAVPLHRFLGLTATVRASFYLYNTKHDIDALIEGIKRTQRLFKV